LRNLNTIPSVVTPHGALEKWALKKSWWKKKLVLTLYEWDNLYNASCLHAVGENEIQHFRDFGLSNPIAVIPNGISSDWLTSCGDPEAFRCRFGIPSDRRILLFLSRITPKKGLPMLLEALRDLQDVLADWLLVIAGEDEFGHRREVERLVEFFGLKRAVIIVGPLFDQSKRDAFAAADLFVLPSHSEGAPLVILEALSSGVPVLATKASPWEDLQVHSCGWWTNISKEAIAEALRDAFSRSPGDLENMGFRGRNLIATRLTWSKSAGMTIQLYEWLLGQRDIPEFVVLG
jgi:glycosyltransferase involved in cell wall biosynthesis